MMSPDHAVLAAFSRLSRAWQGQLNARVHPCAQADSIETSRHRHFLQGCYGAGALALVLLPLHLALAEGPSLVFTLLCAWLMSYLPLGLFLSQTGRLDRAYGFASASFAAFLTAAAWLSGGLTSFALAWIAVVPLLAALSGARRVLLASAGSCALMLVALAVLPAAPASVALGLPDGYALVGPVVVTAGAVVAMIGLAMILIRAHRQRLTHAEAQAATSGQVARMTRDVICRITENGEARPVSGSLSELLGLSPRQARADWLFQRVLVSDRPAYLTALADAREGKAGTEISLRLRCGAHAPGDEGRAEYTPLRVMFRLETSDTAETGKDLFVVLRDDRDSQTMAARLDEAYAQAEQAAQDKNRFVATAAHEMRTPLNAIIGFSDLLRQPSDVVDAQRQKTYVDLIHRSGKHLLQVVEDMLETTTLDLGAKRLTIEPVDLSHVVDDCLTMLAPLAEERAIRLVRAKGSNFPVLAADAQSLRQILINLLGNAIKFSHPGGTVELKAVIEGRSVRVEIIDQGPGIAAEDLLRLGKPFVRLPKAESAAAVNGQAVSADQLVPQGAGLGLSIVKGLCDLHGGTFDLRSELGKGTQAAITLPLGAPRQRLDGMKPMETSLLDNVSAAMASQAASAAARSVSAARQAQAEQTHDGMMASHTAMADVSAQALDLRVAEALTGASDEEAQARARELLASTVARARGSATIQPQTRAKRDSQSEPFAPVRETRGGTDPKGKETLRKTA